MGEAGGLQANPQRAGGRRAGQQRVARPYKHAGVPGFAAETWGGGPARGRSSNVRADPFSSQRLSQNAERSPIQLWTGSETAVSARSGTSATMAAKGRRMLQGGAIGGVGPIRAVPRRVFASWAITEGRKTVPRSTHLTRLRRLD